MIEPTLGDRLQRLLTHRFVGRVDELTDIERWLSSPDIGVIVKAVVAPGGYGKSWLLREAAARASAVGWCTRAIDLSHTGSDLGEALGALTGESLPQAAAAALSTERTLLVLDGWESAPSTGAALLTEFAARLPSSARVLVGSRTDPSRHVGAWSDVVRTLPLHGLKPAERTLCLQRRGIEADRCRRIADKVGGLPLALGLAADLAATHEVDDLFTKVDWDHSLSRIVATLVDPADDRLARAVEAAAVVPRLDSDLLSTILGRPSSAVFEQLCQLSAIRAVAGGIALHDDVRRLVTESLKRQDPSHLALMRGRALSHLHRLAALSDPATRAHLAGEGIEVLGERVRVETVPVELAEEGVGVRAMSPAELAEMVASGRDPADHLPGELRAALDDLLALPGAVVKAAIDREGELRGYGVVAPLSTESTRTLPPRSRIRTVLPAMLRHIGLDALPATDAESNIWTYSVGTAPPDEIEARAALLKALYAVWTLDGAYLLFPDEAIAADFQNNWETFLPFTILDVPAERLQGAVAALCGDVSRSGIFGRLVGALDGSTVASLPVGKALDDVVSEAITRWSDDDHLASSPLASVVAVPGAAIEERASAVRNAVRLAAHSPERIPSITHWLARSLKSLDVGWLPGDPTGSNDLHLAVRLQGRFGVYRDGSHVDIGNGVPATVVKIVALGGQVAVETLIDAVWPGTDVETGRTRLRTTLARLRRAVPDLLVRDGDTIALAPEVWVDATRFDAQARDALDAADADAGRRARLALAAYHGELLPTDRQADWSTAPRERHRRTALALLDRLSNEAFALDDVSSGLQYVERAFELDPYDEHRIEIALGHLIRHGWGLRAQALLHRAEAAADELDMPLGPALSELAMRIRG